MGFKEKLKRYKELEQIIENINLQFERYNFTNMKDLDIYQIILRFNDGARMREVNVRIPENLKDQLLKTYKDYILIKQAEKERAQKELLELEGGE